MMKKPTLDAVAADSNTVTVLESDGIDLNDVPTAETSHEANIVPGKVEANVGSDTELMNGIWNNVVIDGMPKQLTEDLFVNKQRTTDGLITTEGKDEETTVNDINSIAAKQFSVEMEKLYVDQDDIIDVNVATTSGPIGNDDRKEDENHGDVIDTKSDQLMIDGDVNVIDTME